ncbi:MAG: amylo-alpha-1,6-glucosidase [Candidatus Aenigmatarchaeota archaeon]
MDLPKISISKDTLSSIEKSKRLEWIITNGMGCYSSSTVIGMNTRKYHGLLIASQKPPLDRKVVLSKIEDEVIIEGKSYPLSTNRYPDVVYPEGYRLLEKFELSFTPNFFYEIDGVKIKKEIFMAREKNLVFIIYKISGNKEILLKLRPIVNYRSIYDVNRGRRRFELVNDEKTLKIDFGNGEFLKLSIDRGSYNPSTLTEEQKWYKNFFFEIDAERGEESLDDCYNPGFFEVRLKKGKVVLAGSFCDEGEYDYEKLYKEELKRKKKLLENFFKLNKVEEEDWVKWLVLSSDNHLIKRFDGKYSIIAGYHWFGEWGRDTMISLPGICLKTGRLEEAKNILESYLGFMKDGLIPNMFPVREGEKPSHNSVDSALWFVNCIYMYYKKTGDKSFVKRMWPEIIRIIESYVRGVDGIKMDEDFLIKHAPGLTWMDAVVDGKHVTPRGGKAIEIQALWYNCLCIAEELAKELGEDYRKYQFHDNHAKKSFNEKFWNGNCLRDLIEDDTIRPNQLIAIDLPFKIVERDGIENIKECVRKNLLVERGVRTLKEGEGFKGKYAGGFKERDEAYHQGTIWPWLAPILVDKSWLKRFVEDEVNRFGLGTICEIIDGSEPYESKGCISQAWSIGKILEKI